MADFKISTSRLDSGTESVRRHIDQISKQVSELTRQAEIINEMWDGPASDAFQKAFGEDLSALDIMVTNMNKIYFYGTNAKEKYGNCENQVMSVVYGI